MATRKALGKKTRFEVFKRDKFTCQYCGRSAPDVILEVDHIQPVAKDGDDDIMNLITSCFDCNRGKRDKELSDDAVIQKQKAQLDALQERREQITMMLEWQRGLVDIEGQEAQAAGDLFHELCAPCTLNEYGIAEIKRIIKRYGLAETLESLRISASQYLRRDEGGKLADGSPEKVFDYISKICGSRKKTKERPYLPDLYYIRGILRNRFDYIVEYEALNILEAAYLNGASVDELKATALSAKYWYWTAWKKDMEANYGEAPSD